MIRRLAARAAAVDLPLLVLAAAGCASIVMGWALAVAAWVPASGLPAVTVATLALLPLCGVVSLLSFAMPRPVRMAGRPAPAVAASLAARPGATAPRPAFTGVGRGAVSHTPSRVLAGWAGRSAATSPATGRQLPARDRRPHRYVPGRATVPAHHNAPAAATAGAREGLS